MLVWESYEKITRKSIASILRTGKQVDQNYCGMKLRNVLWGHTLNGFSVPGIIGSLASIKKRVILSESSYGKAAFNWTYSIRYNKF